jgi:hypothetical protein
MVRKPAEFAFEAIGAVRAMIGYRSTNGEKNGKWRKIHLNAAWRVRLASVRTCSALRFISS